MTRPRPCRRFVSLAASLVLAATVASAQAADSTFRGGPAYDELANLPVLHGGRVKPLDTVARLEIKLIHGRERIKLLDENDRVVAVWDPIAAFFDMTVRPDFWDDQAFVLVDYIPLKAVLLADRVEARLNAISSRTDAPAALKTAAAEAKKRLPLQADDLIEFSKRPGLLASERQALEHLADRLGESSKWLSPKELEEARISIDGRRATWEEWTNDIFLRASRANAPMLRKTEALTDLEKKAKETAERLLAYRIIRGDRDFRMFDPRDRAVDQIVPRPHSSAYLKFIASAYEQVVSSRHSGSESLGLSDLQNDALESFHKYIENIQGEDRELPGKSREFDSKFAAWIETNSTWLPLSIILRASADELERAGYPAAEMKRFREAYLALREAESKNPGRVGKNEAIAFVLSARRLGQAVGADPTPVEPDFFRTMGLKLGLVDPSHYPTARKIRLETHYNRFAPFYQAPMAYGLGLACLLLALGIPSPEEGGSERLRRSFYAVGMLGFVSGIVLETYGFALRVMISGWAPVTNMYETVVWVPFVCSLLAFGLELRTRKIYYAAAGSGMALLATVLAANVALLGPEIKLPPPVLRSNYWLTIHVLTIVSSYAAFALTLGLGLLALGHYLSATYRRPAPWLDLWKPAVFALPLLAAGGGWLATRPEGRSYVAAMCLLAAGFALASTVLFALAGEAASRTPKTVSTLGALILAAGCAWTFGVLSNSLPDAIDWWGYPTVVVAIGLALTILGAQGAQSRKVLIQAMLRKPEEPASSEPAAAPSVSSKTAGTGAATLSRPVSTIDRIRAGGEGDRRPFDPRGEAMRATAMRIKPLSDFIYRAMQVGVLLVAAGTILGGVWADASWGRFWGWDPKEVWALITLLVYVVPLHGRFAGWINTFRFACASVVCFLAVLMAWYGVNFVLGVGLHSYGFTEGGGQGTVALICAGVLGFAGAAAWRRNVASRVVSNS